MRTGDDVIDQHDAFAFDQRQHAGIHIETFDLIWGGDRGERNGQVIDIPELARSTERYIAGMAQRARDRGRKRQTQGWKSDDHIRIQMLQLLRQCRSQHILDCKSCLIDDQ